MLQELQKPGIKKFKWSKVHTRFKDKICAKDLVEIGSLSSFNSDVKYLLRAGDVSTIYAGVKPLTNEKSKQFLMVLLE